VIKYVCPSKEGEYMDRRIKEIRKANGNISQELFGKRLGLTGATISRLESGDRQPTEAIILSMCREYDVNEDWLRTGEGKMRLKESAEDAERMVNLMRGMSENKKKLFRILVDMPDELLDEMISYMKKEIR
jgi:transcriptional regulator with XRE-family HTH domain